VATGIDGRVMGFGPLALQLLARRRRWFRWAAVGVLLMIIASAVAHVHRRPPARTAVVATVVTRRLLEPGHVLRASDLRVVPDVLGAAGAGARLLQVTDAVGQVVVREIARGEAVANRDVVPALRYYGIGARVPPGMRALTLVVPPAAAFGGELFPGSRVDVIGAFNPERGQGFVTPLTTGIVLAVAAARDRAAPGSGRIAVAGVPVGQASASVDVEIAVPRDREREIVLAQAFGRIFVAVHPAPADAPGEAVSGTLRLLPYLGVSRGGTGGRPVPEYVGAAPPGGAAVRLRAPAAGSDTVPARPQGSNAPMWVVDVIEGDARIGEAVPRAGGERRPAEGVPARDGGAR